MIQKIKEWGQASKTFLVYLVTPIFIVFLVIIELWTRNKELKQEVEEGRANEKTKELDGEQKEIDKQANDAVDQYRRAVDEYNKGRSKSS